MTDARSPHVILDEWRALEAEIESDPELADPALIARIEALRREHAEAMAERQSEAEDLAQPPRIHAES